MELEDYRNGIPDGVYIVAILSTGIKIYNRESEMANALLEGFRKELLADLMK